MNWPIKPVFPTLLAPKMATLYDMTSFGGKEFVSSVSCSAGAKEFDRDLLRLKESPLLTRPITKKKQIINRILFTTIFYKMI